MSDKTHYDYLLDLRASLENEGIRLTEIFEEMLEDPLRNQEQFAKIVGFLAGFNEYYEIFDRFCETTEVSAYNLLADTIGITAIQTQIIENFWRPNIHEIWPSMLGSLSSIGISDPHLLEMVTDQIQEFEKWILQINYDDLEVVPDAPTPTIRIKNRLQFNI